MQNLRDKLLKAGLVSEEQAKKSETVAAKAPRPPSEPSAQRSGPPRGEREERPPREHRGRDERPPRREGPGGGGRPQGAGGRPQGGFRPQGAGGRPQGGRPPQAEAASRPVPKLPPLPGSKAAQRMESKKQVEQDKKLRELVYGGQVPVDVGATVFYFMTRKGKLRRLELTEAQAKQLEDGTLGVVERPEPAQIEHSLVPAAVAEQMYALSKKSVRFLNRKDSPIGFMSDDQVKEQQAAEARGDAPVPDEDDEPSEASASDDAASASPEGTAPEGSSEPTPS
ncbi:hypothetical protein CYFUS_002085 [Cystobacter fuscus]|uniref:DUF2058 family protein n=1 Tax=Cystobacter fuscus TaxID=43 RepID=A0A250IZG9_9BACT|nr:DUF2058 family protein [Cystobacter fuscus]ATB36670.1 hypothetical protein CYFUS_002085 [Cystobacter fuscus]